MFLLINSKEISNVYKNSEKHFAALNVLDLGMIILIY